VMPMLESIAMSFNIDEGDGVDDVVSRVSLLDGVLEGKCVDGVTLEGTCDCG